MGQFSLVSFTFGGNNVTFPTIVAQCVSKHLVELAPPDPNHTCPNDTFVRGLIAKRLGSSYRRFLTEVANKVVVHGGHIVVLGYPDFIELPKFWSDAEQHAGICDGIGTADATQLRGDAGDLDATLGADVAAVNASHPNGVGLEFVNVNSGGPAGPVTIAGDDQHLFEPSHGPRHNLCGQIGPSWLNGITKHTYTTSFHPNALGNAAEGDLLSEVVPHLAWPTGTAPLDADDTIHPAGVCGAFAGQGAPGPVTIRNGAGTAPTGAIVQVEASANIDATGDGEEETAVLVQCGTGGSARWTGVWLYGEVAGKFEAWIGPLMSRSVGASPDSDFGAIETGLAVHGSRIVVSEDFAEPGDCGGCATGRTTTAWNWSPSVGQMVITTPASMPAQVVTATPQPSLFGASQEAPPQAIRVTAGETVEVVCSATDLGDGGSWTELDDGAWMPSSSLRAPQSLPNCNGGSKAPVGSGTTPSTSTPATAPVPSPSPPAITPSASQTATCPTPTALLQAWKASPGIDSATPTSVTGFTNVRCWKEWVVATVQGNGNGTFIFSETGGLHGVTEAEDTELDHQVCTTPAAPSSWINSAAGPVTC